MKTSFTAGGDVLMVKKLPSCYKGLSEIAEFIRRGDIRLCNVETVLSDFDCFPSTYSGGTWVNARPEVLSDILSFGFNMCGAANNHSMDYSYDGLRSTIKVFESYNVPYAGIGESLEQASSPARLRNTELISICSSFNDAARAGVENIYLPSRPGLNPLRYSKIFEIMPEAMRALRAIAEGTKINGERDNAIKMGFGKPDTDSFVFGDIRFREGETMRKHTTPNEADVRRTCETIAAARAAGKHAIVMAHCHEIRVDKCTEPDYFTEEFFHRCIDAGATAIIGGGTHQLKPIEIYKGRPIFYSLGDFVFQNGSVEILPPDFKEKYGVPTNATAAEALAARSQNGKVGLHTDIANYLSVIPYFEAEDDGTVGNIRLLPIELGFDCDEEEKGLPRKADAKTALRICEKLSEISAPYGTRIVTDGDLLRVENA